MSDKYLLIPHLEILNANAASTPYIIGFPTMTAWLGMAHALERSMRDTDVFAGVRLPRMAVSCHRCDLQVFRDENNRYDAIIGTRNPLKMKGSEVAVAPFVETARCHLDVSLLIEVEGLEEKSFKAFETAAEMKIQRLKAAGGDIISNSGQRNRCRLYVIEEDDDVTRQKLTGRLMLGHVLIDRRDLLAQREGQDSLDCLLDVLQGVRPSDGWVVPITVGFRDLSGKIKVKNQRSYEHEHHFAEPLVSLGEFIIPYRLSLKEMMWEYRVDKAKGLYICHNEGKLAGNACGG